MRYALVDADSIAYQACLTSKDNDEEGFERSEEVVIDKITASIRWILDELNENGIDVDFYKLFIGGHGNFRKIIYPEYKANRTASKPVLLGFALDYMRNELEAFSSNYLEADDLVLGCKKHLEDEDWTNEVVVCFIDKDLMQTEGLFLDYYYKRDVRLVTVSKEQAVKNLWTSMLCGDKSDNIITKKGIGIKTAEKILKGQTTHFGAMRVCYAKYLEWFGRNAKMKFIINYRLLRMVTNDVPLPKSYTANI